MTHPHREFYDRIPLAYLITFRCYGTWLHDAARGSVEFKANATRKMREAGCWQSGKTPWVRKGSKRRLWTERELIGAIVYVEYEQGEPLP